MSQPVSLRIVPSPPPQKTTSASSCETTLSSPPEHTGTDAR